MEISILLPTRGRTETLKRSINSLLHSCTDAGCIEFLLAFDTDDTASYEYFCDNIAEKIKSTGAKYTCMGFAPLGYANLHKYVNKLAQYASGRWLLFWNDDAVMQTKNWDGFITETNKFVLLRMLTHNEHPYAIFPVVPKKWVEVVGHLSLHQLNDAWISQVAYMLDIVETIPVTVLHDRSDLTGNNNDSTFKSRVIYEGKPEDPRDFNNILFKQARQADAIKLAEFLETAGCDISWFINVLEGNQDPWEKMTDTQHDPNKQLARIY